MDGIGLELINAINRTIDFVATFVIPFEILMLIIFRRQFLQREILINLACALAIFCTLHTVDLSFKFKSLDFFHEHALHWLTANHSSLTMFALILAHVLIGDLCFYIGHRVRHTKYLFMLEHIVHHSSTELNFVTNLRTSFIVIFYGWIPLIVPYWLGFDPALLLASYSLANALPFFMHHDLIKKMGWLEYIFNTPSHHRVHHASNPGYINKNFGGIFIIWDRLFGTYAEEIEPVVYGISYIKPSANPLKVLFGSWLTLSRVIKRDLRKLWSNLTVKLID
ncbi:MAG TPA: sterol desaturase family protein [Cellvibrionaceae bacterium]